jgi:transcription elongation factor GreB
MNKAFVRESDHEDDDDLPPEMQIPKGSRNYMTPTGHRRLRDELTHLVKKERPEVVSIVSWAASNGDRSENGDYIYGKRRLREIDRRIRFLTKRLEFAEVVDPETQNPEQVFFGATVTYCNENGDETTVTIVGMDEIDTARNHVSWISPVSRALLKSRIGDTVYLRTPGGVEELEVLDIVYRSLDPK